MVARTDLREHICSEFCSFRSKQFQVDGQEGQRHWEYCMCVGNIGGKMLQFVLAFAVLKVDSIDQSTWRKA